MVSAYYQQGKNRPDEEALPHSAQSMRQSASMRRLFERRLNDLELAHDLG